MQSFAISQSLPESKRHTGRISEDIVIKPGMSDLSVLKAYLRLPQHYIFRLNRTQGNPMPEVDVQPATQCHCEAGVRLVIEQTFGAVHATEASVRVVNPE
jgi:hypothetical protein